MAIVDNSVSSGHCGTAAASTSLPASKFRLRNLRAAAGEAAPAAAAADEAAAAAAAEEEDLGSQDSDEEGGSDMEFEEGSFEDLPSYEFRFETAKLLLELDDSVEAASQVGAPEGGWC